MPREQPGGHCLLLSILICTLIPGLQKAPGQTRLPRIDYVSPVPGSRFVHPETNIILRTATPLGMNGSCQLVLAIRGERSGGHDFRVRISDDGRTMLIQPNTPFAVGEQVDIQVDTSAGSWTGTAVHAGSFTFTTGALRVPPPPLGAALRAAELPPSVAGPGRVRNRSPKDAAGSIIVPDINVSISRSTSPGYLFLSNWQATVSDVPALLILRNDGTPVFARDLSSDATDFTLQPNGRLSYYDEASATFIIMDSSCTIIDTIACGNGYVTDAHELRLLPNGHALLLADDYETMDLSSMISNGSSSAQVIGCVIQELDRARNVVFQWRSFDYFTITDASHVDLTGALVDYVHGNALDIDTDGNILLSSRHLSEITKINRETGAIIWRLGGMNNQFQFVNDTLGFSYQHAVRSLGNGHITLFDNGDFHDPPFSRAVEYALDEEHRTATLVWQYRNSPDVFSFAMGYVQRMINGNTLIGWGAGTPTVTEIDSTGTKVYEMSFDPGIYSYRAYRYVWAPGESSRPLAGTPQGFRLDQNFPNPFNPSTTIRYFLPNEARVRLEVYTILGQLVATLVDGVVSAGEHAEQFSANGLASGVYLYKLQAGSLVQTKKLLLLH